MAKFWFYVAYVLCGVLWVVTLFSVGSEGTYTKTYWLGKKPLWNSVTVVG